MKTTAQTCSKTMAAIFLILLFLSFTTGCYYYKVQTYPKIIADELITYDSAGKYLILHEGDTAWHLSNLKIEGRTFSGSVSPLPSVHQKYKSTRINKPNRYIKSSTSTDESVVINEVHLYVTNLGSKKDSIVKGTLSSINQAVIYNHDKKKTNRSWVLGITLPLVGGLLVVFIVAIIGSGGLFGGDIGFGGM